jgi:S1-C subfamily serine protease
MSKTEKRLIIGLVLFGGFAMVGAALVAGTLLLTGLGALTFERTGGSNVPTNAVEAPVALPAPTIASNAGQELENKLKDLLGSSTTRTSPQDAKVLPAPSVDLGADLSALYEAANPGVVNLLVSKSGVTMGNVEIPQEGAGSGWVYDDTHIVTNNHVTTGADDIEVVFFDGARRKGKVVGADVYADLAVVEVTDMPSTARVLPLVSDLQSLKVGQPVVAIGNPFNKANSMSFGIISALGRTMPDGTTRYAIPETIQTDAAINPGNSGGPLLDLRGEVIGVNAQINTTNYGTSGTPGNSGVGFAIPASIVARVVPDLIKSGHHAWSYLGVSGGAITFDAASANNLRDTKGAYISCVSSGGPSAGALEGADNVQCDTAGAVSGVEAGAEAPIGGDVVTAVNGQPVNSFDDLLSYIALKTSPGDTVRLTVLRDGAQKDVEVTLKARPEATE